MKKFLLVTLFLLAWVSAIAQTKVSGLVVDEYDLPLPYANIKFKGSNQTAVSDENGKFYMESDQTFTVLVVSFVGFETKEFTLPKAVNYNYTVKLSGAEMLNEVTVFAGKTSKKNNPAIDILRKIWERKRKNGLHMFDHYEMDKYEKVEFDMNTIDSTLMKSRLFKGMEFVFNHVDTSKITGKTYLPIFINEALSKMYGNNKLSKQKEVLIANKNSGFSSNQQILAFINDLYSDYNIYNNYLTFFDKSFASPLSRFGIDTYNYVLRDSAFIDNKWCYNIVFYPRRKNELTFKGDFWVNDTTFAIKEIAMAASRSANINWVKEIYIEQEFDVVNDSVFLLTRDYMMTDFALTKKDESRGIYGKRTTLYDKHRFNVPKPGSFFTPEVNRNDPTVYEKDDAFWEENRLENLNKDEKGIYTMLDTLQTVKKFRRLYSTVEILGSGYVNYGPFDYGPIFSSFGFNEVEKFRVRAGGRTYFGPNDPWRVEGYGAYGFGDKAFKYGVSGKWMIDSRNRVILSAGYRKDIEQIGASLTSSNDVLGRSFASSSLFTVGSNGKLTKVELGTAAVNVELLKNFTVQVGMNHRRLESASEEFSMDYYSVLPTDTTPGEVSSVVNQAELSVQLEWTPRRKTIGFGVERDVVDNPYTRVFVNYASGVKDLFNSDFDYQKLQLYVKQPVIVGLIGRSNFVVEAGKTFGEVPLGLMNVVPGNQTYFTIENTFANLNFYEFVADEYLTLQWEHNFQGKLFSRIPGIRDLNLREIVGLKSVVGNVSDANRALNASGMNYIAPTKPYWEYSVGVGNIFKVFRIDFSWRGNYLDMPDAQKFAVKGAFGFHF